MSELSKSARNERRKLTATYFNNTAIGLLLTGYFAPALSFILTADQKEFTFERYLSGQMEPDKIAKVQFLLFVIVTSFAASWLMHLLARTKVNKLED